MTTDSGPSSSHDNDLPSVDRLLTLSDGVVAIALTLLVLQLKVPSLAHPDSPSELARELGNGGDQLVAYGISFYVIAQFWLVHYRVFRQVAGQQEGVAWWNFAFLFTITVMPFTSSLLGKYASNPLAVNIFAVNLLLASLATQATLIFGRRKGLVVEGTGRESLFAGRMRLLATTLVIALSIGLAWVNTDAAKYCWLLLALAPRVADRLTERHERAKNRAQGRG